MLGVRSKRGPLQSDTIAPGANDSATIRSLSELLHRRRRPTPLRISTRPRGAEASTIWSTIYANRCHQQVRIFRTMPLAARWGKDTAYGWAHAIPLVRGTWATMCRSLAARTSRTAGGPGLWILPMAKSQLVRITATDGKNGAFNVAPGQRSKLIGLQTPDR